MSFYFNSSLLKMLKLLFQFKRQNMNSILKSLFSFTSDTFYEDYLSTTRSIALRDGKSVRVKFKLYFLLMLYQSVNFLVHSLVTHSTMEQIISYDAVSFLFQKQLNLAASLLGFIIVLIVRDFYFSPAVKNNVLLEDIVLRLKGDYFMIAHNYSDALDSCDKFRCIRIRKRFYLGFRAFESFLVVTGNF